MLFVYSPSRLLNIWILVCSSHVWVVQLKAQRVTGVVEPAAECEAGTQTTLYVRFCGWQTHPHFTVFSSNPGQNFFVWSSLLSYHLSVSGPGTYDIARIFCLLYMAQQYWLLFFCWYKDPYFSLLQPVSNRLKIHPHQTPKPSTPIPFRFTRFPSYTPALQPFRTQIHQSPGHRESCLLSSGVDLPENVPILLLPFSIGYY